MKLYILSKISYNMLYRKFDTNIPRNETARPRSQFLHSCICERFIYFHDRCAYFAVLGLRTDLEIYNSITDT
jgi:hypothetical protein